MCKSIQLITLKIKHFGQFLSNIIMPNISVFITYGIMSALFIPLGWYPNKLLEQLILPILFYLLPICIGYTGGHLIANHRGGLVGGIATIGMIESANIPMLLGAMIIGPLGGYVIKLFDHKIDNKIKCGFEMLVNNFSVAVFGILLSIISFLIIGPFLVCISNILSNIIKIILYYHLLPLISIIIEPAKIFFLNNAINHVVFSPLGIQDLLNNRSSVFFLIESNPGPGLGVLVAWLFFGSGELRKSAGTAAIVEFIGGVHEIYFPYVLKKPKLIISLILGSMTGIFILVLFDGGLISAVSPGSILSILVMTPKNLYLINIIAIFLSFSVSFFVSYILLKYDFNMFHRKKNNLILDKFSIKKSHIDNFSSLSLKHIKKIIIACDAGMGSSAMGASILRKKIQNSSLKNISVLNMAINSLPKTKDLIITHQNLTDRAKKYAPYAQHISLKNFLSHTFYDNLIKKLLETAKILDSDYVDISNIKTDHMKYESYNIFQLSEKNIFLNQYAKNKEEAIKLVGQYLVDQGYVKMNYIKSMLEREKISSTWLGESIALPHGTIAGKESVLSTGIIFCQFPQGVHFGEEVDDIAYLVVGVAAKNNEHITVVSNITNALDNKDIIKRLSQTNDVKEALSLLTMKNK